MSNEFKGATLEEAVSKAVAMETRKRRSHETKSSCSDFRNKFDSLKNKADRIWDRTVDLQREVDQLESTARLSGLSAVVAAIVAASGALGSAAKIAARLKRLKLHGSTREEILQLIPVVGSAFVAAIAALAAIDALKEAARLKRDVERLRYQYDDLANEMLSIASSYERQGCHLSPGRAS